MFYTLAGCNWEALADKLKYGTVSLTSFITAYLAPVETAFTTLFVLWTANNIIGIISVVGVRRAERFRLKKSFTSLVELIAYFVLLILAKITIYDFGEHGLFALVSKYLTWLISYWYLVNVLRNIHLAAPKFRAVSFLYKLVSFKGLPILLRRFGISDDDVRDLTDNEEEIQMWDRGKDGARGRSIGAERRGR